MGAFRLYPTVCNVILDFAWNHRLKVIKGREFFDHEKRLRFTPIPDEPTTYKTYVWGGIYHLGVEYSSCAENLRGALERMTKVRAIEQPGYDQILRNHQLFATQNVAWLKMMRFYQRLVTHHLETIGDPFEAFHNYAHQPHPKRTMRVLEWLQILKDGILFMVDTIRCIQLNVKKYEWARPGKYARGVYDLTVRGATFGGWITDLIKTVIAGNDYSTGYGKFRFVKSATYENMYAAFAEMNHTDTFFYVAHSDDALIVVYHNGTYYYYDIDIKSCESSHFSIFDSLYLLIPKDWWLVLIISQLIKQLTANVVVFNPAKTSEVVIFNVPLPILFSGTTLTTLVNTMAHMLAYIQLSALLIGNLKPDNTVEIMEAGAYAGYLFTVTRNTVREKATLLKTFQTVDDNGVMKIAIALGVIFRTIGCCRGDLPGKNTIPLHIRAGMYNAGLITAFMHAGDTSVLRCMTEKWCAFKPAKVHRSDQRYQSWTESGNSITDVALMRRYDVADYEIAEFVSLYEDCQPGELTRCQLTAQVMKIDYELEKNSDPIVIDSLLGV